MGQSGVVLEDIDRIEVVGGPGGWQAGGDFTLGANAANGIINNITKPAEATQGDLVNSWQWHFGSASATVRYEGRVDGLGFSWLFSTYTKNSGGVDAGDACVPNSN